MVFIEATAHHFGVWLDAQGIAADGPPALRRRFGMDADPPTWEIGLLGDAVADVVDACRRRGAQALSKRGERMAVVISAEDWDAIRSLLKDRLAEGSQVGDPAQIVELGGVRVRMPGSSEGA